MRRIAVAFALLLGLDGCAQLQSLTTASGALASPQAMAIAANGFDAVEATATAYVGYCTPKPMPSGCSVSLVQKVIKAVQNGRVARNNLEAFVKANPGVAGPSTLVAALTTATATLQQIEASYNITGAPKA